MPANQCRLRLLLITSLLTSMPLLAAPELEEVIVTAQKRAQNLQDVPMAVTALGREFLENNEINNVEDLTKLVPSMRFTPGDDPTNASIRIRGVGTNVFSIAVEPNVSVVVDEVPLARNSLASFEFADLERIEVLRGPQGTLFGKNSTAGLIHVITRDPAEELEAFVRMSLEDQEHFPSRLQKLQFGVSNAITDNAGARFTGFAKSTDGHLEDVLQHKKTPDSDTLGGRLKFRWDASDVLSLRLNMEYQRTEGDSTPLVFRNANPEKAERSPEIEYGDENRTTKTFGNDVADIRNRAVSMKVDWEIGDYVLTAVTGWRKWNILRDLSIPDLNGERVDVTRNGGTRQIRTFTQEFRATFTGEGPLEYTVGVLWFDNQLDNDFERVVEDIPSETVAEAFVDDVPTLALIAMIPGESFGQYGRTVSNADTENLGIFAQGTWHITDLWHLTAGARYIDEDLTSSAYRISDLTSDDSDTQVQSSETTIPATTFSDTAGTGTVSLQYDWRESTTLYGTISTGYRGGAFDLANSDLESAFADPVSPEKALSFELGAKSRLWDNRLELNIALFQTTFEDFQAQIVDVPPAELTSVVPSAEFRLDNAGELETRGVEIDFKAQLSESLFLFGSYLFNRAVFNEFTTQCFVGQQPGEAGGVDENGDDRCDTQDVAGGVLPNAPKHSVTLNLRYEHVFNNGSDRAFAQIGARWLDDIQFSAEQHPLTIQKAYDIWDLRLGWNGMDDRLEISAYIKNLFAQHYATGFFPLSLVNDRRDISYFHSPDSDRTFGMSVGYRL